MENFIRKLLLGKPVEADHSFERAIHKRVKNIKAIWNNEQHDDIGIEKILRLFLAISQFIFIGTYVKQLFGKRDIAHQDLSVDVLVICKTVAPIVVLYFNLQTNPFVFWFLMWFMFETLLYVPTLIFASDIFSKPRSYRRSMLLLFFNYLEVIVDFGVIYAAGNYMNKPFENWFDPCYFSFITSSTTGFGDFFPVTATGRFLVSCQTVTFFMFVVLFLNFFTSKAENKGYFDNSSK